MFAVFLNFLTTLYLNKVKNFGSGVRGHCQNESRPSPQDSNAMFLGVNRFAPKHGIEGDMGWVPPTIRRKIEMLRLWNRIVGMQNDRLPKIIYSSINTDSLFWVKDIKELFESLNCANIFQYHVKIIIFKEIKEHAQNKLFSCYNSA